MGLFNFWKKKNQSKVLLPAQKAKRISKIGVPAPKQYRVECEIVYKGTPLSTVELKITATSRLEAERLVKTHVEFRPRTIHQIKK
jgi:hypothetical protein